MQISVAQAEGMQEVAGDVDTLLHLFGKDMSAERRVVGVLLATRHAGHCHLQIGRVCVTCKKVNRLVVSA